MYYWFGLDSTATCVELCHLLTLWGRLFSRMVFVIWLGKAFRKRPTKIHDVPFCRSLVGNQIEELPAGVFSNNKKLLNLWVGRLKVHSWPTYFYYHILLQILVNSKKLKYDRTLMMSPSTIALSSFSRVPQYIFVSDWRRFHRFNRNL